jgi:hypothetical protein
MIFRISAGCAVRCRAWRSSSSGTGCSRKRDEQAVGRGEIEPALEGPSGRLPLTERVPGARLEQESRDHPHLMRSRSRADQDGRERGGRCSRVALGEPQRRHRGADTWPFAFGFGHLGQGGIGLRGLPQPHQDVQEECAHLGRERVRCEKQPAGRSPGGTQGG